jgi:hypothetical protein
MGVGVNASPGHELSQPGVAEVGQALPLEIWLVAEKETGRVSAKQWV